MFYETLGIIISQKTSTAEQSPLEHHNEQQLPTCHPSGAWNSHDVISLNLNLKRPTKYFVLRFIVETQNLFPSTFICSSSYVASSSPLQPAYLTALWVNLVHPRLSVLRILSCKESPSIARSMACGVRPNLSQRLTVNDQVSVPVILEALLKTINSLRPV